MGTSWITPGDLPDIPGLDPTINLVDVCAAATDLLYVGSGRQFLVGNTVTVRPQALDVDMGCLPWYFASWGGWGTAWSIWPLSAMYPEGWYCGCPSQAQYDLPGPVQSISQVKVNGSILTEGTDYVLYNGRTLQYMTTNNNEEENQNPCWPTHQNLGEPDTEMNTWSITYTYGKPIPASGKIACRMLAIDIAMAMSNLPGTKLPARVTSVARAGINAVVQDSLAYIEKGFTGLPLVDQFLQKYNPLGLVRRPSVWSPDSVVPNTVPNSNQ